MINYRVNVGTESKNHWINDPIEGGGRVIGEVCHFLDLCYWFVEAEPERIFAEKISSDSRLIDDNNIAATIYFSDGSVASLTYTTLGSSSFPKERIEIFADGAVIVIDDFKRLILEGFKGKSIKLRRADKGHYNELIEFSKAIRGEKSTAVTVEDGVRATVCSFKILEALKSRKTEIFKVQKAFKDIQGRKWREC
jgi:predicted dehydrogenase